MPHIRLLDPEHGSTSLANLFGLPYVIEAKSRPFDRTTLHNNWQRNGTEAFSLYTGMTVSYTHLLVQKASAGIFITRKKIRRILQAVRDDFCILQENHGIKKKK